LILGIFSAAAMLLTKTGFPHSYPIVIYLSVMAFIIGGIGFHAIDELHDLRVAARDLLVRCEIGLGFYDSGAFLKEEMLYTNYELAYPMRGGWMRQYRWIVVMVFG